MNRATGEALNDPTEGNPTATTEIGTILNVAIADSLDIRQQWDLVKQGDDRFNLINRFSQHEANLSGGSSSDGTRIVSYTSDERNKTSNNRLWTITSVDEVVDGIEDTRDDDFDYALAYDPTGDRLHFGSERPEGLTFMVNVYDQGGRLMRTFRASEECSLRGLPRGLYIVSWKFAGKRRSVKFIK